MPTAIVEENLDVLYQELKNRFIRNVMHWDQEMICPRCQSRYMLTEEDKEQVRVGHYYEWDNSFYVDLNIQCPVCNYPRHFSKTMSGDKSLQNQNPFTPNTMVLLILGVVVIVLFVLALILI